jgi:hypothetical protein
LETVNFIRNTHGKVVGGGGGLCAKETKHEGNYRIAICKLEAGLEGASRFR